LESGKAADTALLKTIIEVIDMQEGVEVMKKYYSEEAWERHRRYYEEGPSPEWRSFYRDAQALLGSDPGAPEAQALVERWFELAQRAYNGDPEVQTDSPRAWIDREHWPPVMKQRMVEFRIEEVSQFIRLAESASRKQFFSEAAWTRLLELQQRKVEDHSRMWQDRVDLFRDLEKALDEDPAGAIAQALVARWSSQLDKACGGDAEIRAALLQGWSHRRHWLPSMRWRVEGLHMMSFNRFEKAADFLDKARAAATAGTIGEGVAMTLLAEIDQEMANTRRMLECVPEEKFAWKPHEKSSTLAKLANHLAAIPLGVAFVINGQGSKPSEAASKAHLLKAFDERASAVRAVLAEASEDRLAETIRVTPVLTKTRSSALKWMMSHMIHHRGQLSVYLRLLDVPVPGMYGDSADERP
jgi:uncharacterized damage-inducible protein DinB